MNNKSLVLLILFIACSKFSIGQNQSASTPKNGVEVNVLFPIFPGNIINAKYTRTLWQKGHLKGDILIGFNMDLPENRETEGRFSDKSLITGYRQYFWKGLFAEYAQNTGFGKLQNHVSTGKNYDSFDWFVATTAGYKMNFGKSKKIYSIFQVGMANVLYKSNPWPIFEDKTLKKEVGEQPLFYGGVQVGINF